MTNSDTPLVRVVRGNPDEVELTALVAAVTQLLARRAAHRSTWGVARLRGPVLPAPQAWRASGLPD